MQITQEYWVKFQISEFFQQEIVKKILSINLNMCFGYSKEPSHCDRSFEFPQHMLRKVIFNYIILSEGLLHMETCRVLYACLYPS